MNLYLRKHNGALVPDPSIVGNVENFDRLPEDKTLRAETKRVRNPANHRRYFVMVNALFGYQSTFDNQEHFLSALKVAAGHYEDLGIVDGKHVMQPKSISYASMGEDDFKKFYEECVQAVYDNTEYFGITEANRQAVYEMLMEF